MKIHDISCGVLTQQIWGKFCKPPLLVAQSLITKSIFQMSNLKKSLQLSYILDKSPKRYYGFSMAATFIIGFEKKIHITGTGFKQIIAQICWKCWISSRIAIFQKLNLKNSSEGVNHLNGYFKRYYGFCLNVNCKKNFSDFASPKSGPDRYFDLNSNVWDPIDPYGLRGHLKPPISAQRRRICTFTLRDRMRYSAEKPCQTPPPPQGGVLFFFVDLMKVSANF